MYSFYWDASALGKHYAPENGTDLVNRIFQSADHGRMRILWIGAAEIVSIVVRRRNTSMLTSEDSGRILQEIRREILESPRILLESVTDSVVSSSLSLISKHNINATDAVVLRSALDAAESLRGQGDSLVLVAADTRLVRAARAEGLTTFNPESDTSETLDTLAPTVGA